MNAFLSKLAVLGVVAGGFYATGDLPRLIDRGRRIAERTTVPPPVAKPVAAGPMHAEPPPPPVVPPSVPPAPPPVDQPPAVAARPEPTPPQTPAPKAAATPTGDRAADEPTRIPMPPLRLEAVDLAALEPGQRVLLLSGGHVVALDVVDGPAGEVLEHAHACHADRTVTIASSTAARRLVVVGCSAGSARGKPRSDRRIARGAWLHVLPSGGTGVPSGGTGPSGGALQASGNETIGPIEAIGLE